MFKDVTIAAQFEITKLPAKTDLRFTKLTIPYRSTVTAQDILAQVTGTKGGYTLKNIVFVSTTDVAELTGLSLSIKKNRCLCHQYYVATPVL